MNYKQFSNLSCYEEFEIKSSLAGISKIDVLKEIGHQINDYYFFISNDGIFNWFDLEGNHVEDPGVLKDIIEEYIPKNITKCIIPNGVIHIGCYAFYNCESLTSITIPNGVTHIYYYAFCNCNSLKEIIIPNSIKNIGTYAFYNCISLREITLPNNVTSIGNDAFYRCKSLKSITIPDSVKYIGLEVFSYCRSLESITIPDSVKNIGNNVFSYCESLKEVIFKGRTLEEVKQMKDYPFGIEDDSIIRWEI